MQCVIKFIALIVLLGVCGYTSAAEPTANCVQDRIFDLIARWRRGEPLPLPIPSLDPLRLQSYTGNFDNLGIKVAFISGEMDLRGFKNFALESVSVTGKDTLKVSGTVNFPQLIATGDNYSLTGKAYIVYPLKGQGAMTATLNNVKAKFVVTVKSHGQGTQLADTQMSFRVNNAKVYLKDSSWPINDVLAKESKNIIESYHEDISDLVMASIEETLNKSLATVTMAQLTTAFVGDCAV